jgi:hypothetical protein
MRYRVAFTRRESSGDEDREMKPSVELDLNLSDGIVAEKVLVEQLESDARHNQETLDEDDAFLGSAAAEVWEYEIVDGNATDFEDALKNSDLVLEYEVIDDTPIDAGETSATPIVQDTVYPRDGTPSESARDVDDGEVLQIKEANDKSLGLTGQEIRK